MSDAPPRRPIYVFDTNVLMDWQARYYPTDVFDSLLARVDGLIADHRFVAPELVQEELLAVGTAELTTWATGRASIWVPTGEILAPALTIQNRFPGLRDPKADFEGADAYLIALAQARDDGIVITQETSAAEKKNPKRTHFIPDVCRELGLPCISLLGLMRKVQDPAKLRRLIVNLIDKEQWSSLSADVKGDSYEGLLQKNAEDVKGGAGQYFTPRALIAAMVDAIAPSPGQSICDPACSTGGFLLAAHDYLAKHHQLDRAQGVKANVRRLRRHFCRLRASPNAARCRSRLSARIIDRKPAADKKAWMEKLWIYDLRTNQHFTLKENTLKREHLQDFVDCYFGNVGSSLADGPRHAGKRQDKSARHGREVQPYKDRHHRVETERFKPFTYDDLLKRDKVNLDIFWLKDEALEESANLPPPDVIATEIVQDLEAALEQFREIEADLKE